MSRPRFLADNDLNDAIVLGVLRREPAIEFKRLRDRGLETFCRDNDQAHLPGPLQELEVARNQQGGPGQVQRLVRRRQPRINRYCQIGKLFPFLAQLGQVACGMLIGERPI